MNVKTKTFLWFGKLKEQIKYVHIKFRVINIFFGYYFILSA